MYAKDFNFTHVEACHSVLFKYYPNVDTNSKFGGGGGGGIYQWLDPTQKDLDPH